MYPEISEWIVEKSIEKDVVLFWESFWFYSDGKGWANLELAFCLHGGSFECFHLKNDKPKNERTLCGQRNLTVFHSDKW